MSHHQNIERIKVVYNSLEEIAGEVVFVGGATVSLYADRPAVEVRPTDDIDIMVEVAGYGEYVEIEKKLIEKGFSNDQASPVLCRYKVKGITVDVMPTDHTILGFSNRWYKPAFASAIYVEPEKGYRFRILRPEYFVGTKLEAFKGRGKADGRTSSDFEDIIYILNNRTKIWREMLHAEPNLRNYLKENISRLLAIPYLHEWIASNLDYHESERQGYILRNMEALANFDNQSIK